MYEKNVICRPKSIFAAEVYFHCRPTKIVREKTDPQRIKINKATANFSPKISLPDLDADSIEEKSFWVCRSFKVGHNDWVHRP